jgi:transposase InsO family protein
VVQTLTFQTLNVFFLISHDRRRLLHFDVTSHPTAAWVWRQMIEATLWGQHPILPQSQGHVRPVLAGFVSYYNQDRPHRSLGLEAPVPSPRQVEGEVVSRPVLNGLHHVYERAA